VPQINELECVGDSIYANVWQTNAIVRIDKADGRVTGIVDARGLLTTAQRRELTYSGAVLNGIAYNAEDETFFITGKYWPWMFKVALVEVEMTP
jgi:glutamine cyclotransferase